MAKINNILELEDSTDTAIAYSGYGLAKLPNTNVKLKNKS